MCKLTCTTQFDCDVVRIPVASYEPFRACVDLDFSLRTSYRVMNHR